MYAKWSQNFCIGTGNPFPPNWVEGSGKTKLYYGVPLSKEVAQKPPEHSMSNVQGCFKAGDTSSCPIRLRSEPALSEAERGKIWREDLIGPAAAMLFVLRTKNLPASKEGGQGDCDRTNREDG